MSPLRKLVIVGAGGFGREVLDVVEAMNLVTPTFEFLGFLDDNVVESDVVARRSSVVLGGIALLARLEADYLIGIGAGDSRRRIDQFATVAGLRPAVAIHPAATLGGDVRVGPGTVIAAGARLTTNISIGRHVHVNINATIGHDCHLGNYVTVNPGVNVSGNVTLDEGVTLGTGSCVIQGLSVGAYTVVGAGAAVVRDLPAKITAVGVPARPR